MTRYILLPIMELRENHKDRKLVSSYAIEGADPKCRARSFPSPEKDPSFNFPTPRAALKLATARSDSDPTCRDENDNLQRRTIAIDGVAIAGPTFTLQVLSHPILRARFRPVLFDRSLPLESLVSKFSRYAAWASPERRFC